MLNDYERIVNNMAGHLDRMMMRNKLVASNIANVDTPGYKSKDMNFEKVLSDSMNMRLKQTHSKHMGEMQGISTLTDPIVEDSTPGRPDGNNVDIDDEMMKLTEIGIQYNATVQLVSKKLRQISDTIQQAR
ncbi:MAG: flagellar basal body rod protein FlgB [Candidatus Omnitrophota bacterium]